MFGFEYINRLVDTALTQRPLTEVPAAAGGPCRTLYRADEPTVEAGFLRLWRGADDGLLDRMIHFRLIREPVDTQLFFLFGRDDTAMPHFHAQVVQFAPDACVFNADFLSRLDPVDHPDYYTEVFGPLTRPYWKTVNDRNNICALAPANPAIAAYLTPWSIGCGRPTDRAELERVSPHIDAFLAHYLTLAGGLSYTAPDAAQMRERNRRHLDRFFAEDLDPRAWKGVYGVIGEEVGRQVKATFQTALLD